MANVTLKRVDSSNEAEKEKKLNPSYMYANITKRVDDDGAIKAYAAVTLSNAVTLHGIKVVEGKDGLFVSMPQKQAYDPDTGTAAIDENGRPVYEDIVHPITQDARNKLIQVVIDAYNNEEDYAYINADKINPRNTKIVATMYPRNGDQVKAAGDVKMADFVCHDVIVAMRKNSNNMYFASMNIPSYASERKDGSKIYTEYFEFKENGHGYDFNQKKEVEMNFKHLAQNIVVKSAKEVNPDIEQLISINKEKEQDAPIVDSSKKM